ncbi:MAG: CopG family transcriptional regulator [Actinomycetota bacterium]
MRAAELDVSVAELIRRAVDRFLGEPDQQAARRRMVSSLGGFRSGHSDISEEHDRYLGHDFG